MRKLAALAALLFVLPDCGHGCDCVPLGSVSHELAAADAVFVGRFIWTGEKTVRDGISEVSRREYMFRVSRAWKGVDVDTVSIFVVGTACDVPFRLNETYLVYAERTGLGGVLTTNTCTRTAEKARASDDFIQLPTPVYLNRGVAE